MYFKTTSEICVAARVRDGATDQPEFMPHLATTCLLAHRSKQPRRQAGQAGRQVGRQASKQAGRQTGGRAGSQAKNNKKKQIRALLL
jgi:hypothetical protein